MGSEVVPAASSGEEARRRSPQTRLMCPHSHGYETEPDIKPEFLKTRQRQRVDESTSTPTIKAPMCEFCL